MEFLDFNEISHYSDSGVKLNLKFQELEFDWNPYKRYVTT